MKSSTFFSVAAFLAVIVSASPSKRQNATSVLSNFYLVTTDQQTSALNSSSLKNVSLTTLFDPYYQAAYLLRLVEPGYGSVPVFNLTDGTLHVDEAGPHGIGEYEYNSTAVYAGSELQFEAAPEGKGDLELKDGYLLAVNGSAVGWTICTEELGQSVVSLFCPLAAVF